VKITEYLKSGQVKSNVAKMGHPDLWWVSDEGHPSLFLGRWNCVLGVKMHLPASVTTEPDGRDVGIARHRACSTGRRLGGLIDDGCSIRSDEGDARVDYRDGSESACGMELFEECEDLIAVPNPLFNIDEVRQ
jgi:hypothetical protein